MASSSSSSSRPSQAPRQHPPHGRSAFSYLSRSIDGQPPSGLSVRSKAPAASRRSVTPNSRTRPNGDDASVSTTEPARVRVAVRLRPRNTEDLLSDADFADCVELQPELKKLKLKKNNWSSESYRFDEVFSESASQRRVYEVVAKPVIESVLNGYNGTVMAYGQTGTGKTYTLGRLGKDEASERGIMVRAMEDIISSTSPASDSIEVSYLQLYLEAVQDLLAPEKINIPIVDDPKTGEVTLPGAVVVKIRDLHHFLQLLQTGEANRHAANTKINTESSRSHAILMVNIRRSVHEEENDTPIQENNSGKDFSNSVGIPIIRKSKLLIVDLAGSERLDKSGSEGYLIEEAKFINLSLTSLGKCINALAENSPHIPTRDSKLTRLLRDSFGGSVRTSLIITIGPSSRHYAETTSTIMFGQRAMKVVNMVKLKEEFDYESLCRKLENQVEHLTVEIDREQKLRDNDRIEMERKLKECQKSFAETEKCLVTRSEFLEKENVRLETEMKDTLKELNCLKDQNDYMQGEAARLEMNLIHSKQYQLESSSYQKVLADTTQMYEKKIAELMKQLEEEQIHSERAEKQLDGMEKLLNDHKKSMQQQYQMESSMYQKALADTTQMYERKIAELNQQLDDKHACFEISEELEKTKKLLSDHQKLNQLQGKKEIDEVRMKLQESHRLHQKAANELEFIKSEYKVLLTEKAKLMDELNAARKNLLIEEKQRKAVESELLKLKKLAPENEEDFEDKRSYMKENISQPLSSHKSNQSRETILGQRATIAKICEEVGLEKILQLLASGDIDVQIHAVKVVANLAAEDINQTKIVEEGGLDALLMLLRSSQNTTILRVASGAIANLAMNEMNQFLIMSKGGAQLLANIASRTDDPQTLRMVAGAIANLCGNGNLKEKLHASLREDGAVKALLGIVQSGNSDVIAQVARGIANFAKCESRGIIQGHRRGRSVLVEDGMLTWLIANSNTASASSRRHIELALCHLAQNDDNARDIISSGGVKELERISVESTREDIRSLAKKILRLSPTFSAETHADR
ncbi:kinesin-like protein KIN-UC isoform X3 [Diospyros lotus]|uniref:kinesin-like protein KIN-UC isoform X3 n=1 Tax=Diospyros lotus TaxID=55363 RepID=UPI00225796F0|nr:kinesin-like protein KIN-UC isoform X3 [Diospyros lotus]